MTTHTASTARPFGYWLKAVDRLMADEFARAFEHLGLTRRHWRLLNAVDGTAPGDAPHRPLSEHSLHPLIERGLVVADGDGWSLTPEGRETKERLGTQVDGIRTMIADAVAPEDMATTMATLEKIAIALGWDENAPLPRRRRAHRHHGHGHHGHHHSAHHHRPAR